MTKKSAPTVAIVTAADMPKPDLDIADLGKCLKYAGVNISILPWDSDARWDAFDLVFVKSTWDYFKRLPEFLEWANKTSKITRLESPSNVIAWNADKRYLEHLQCRCVPTIPTSFVAPWSDNSCIQNILDQFQSKEIVIKPAISIGAIGALRVSASDLSAFSHIRSLLDDGHVLIQPFVSSVLDEGEISLVYFNGQFSHAVRKLPSKGEYRVQDHYGGKVHPFLPTSAELAVADAALAAAPAVTLIARVDLVMIGGAPHVIELELIEPALFLSSNALATSRLVAAISERIAS